MGNVIMVSAYEIEHMGDLDSAESEIVKAGGKILARRVSYEDEDAHFKVDIGDQTKEQFAAKLEQCEV